MKYGLLSVKGCFLHVVYIFGSMKITKASLSHDAKNKNKRLECVRLALHAESVITYMG